MRNRLIRALLKLRRLRSFLAQHGVPVGKLPRLKAAFWFVLRALRPKAPVLIEAQRSKMYVDPADEFLQLDLLASGVHEEAETKAFCSLVEQGMTVVDVGANIGYYTLLAARLVGASGRVIALEPSSANYRLLTQNVALNGYENVTVLNLAAGEKPGQVRLYLDPANFGNCSLSSANVPVGAGSEEVEVTTLDHLLDAGVFGGRVDLIKLDVQGAQGLVLRGAQRTLGRFRPKIMMEFASQWLKGMGSSPLEIMNRLEPFGYSAYALNGSVGAATALARDQALAYCETHAVANFLLRVGPA